MASKSHTSVLSSAASGRFNGQKLRGRTARTLVGPRREKEHFSFFVFVNGSVLSLPHTFTSAVIFTHQMCQPRTGRVAQPVRLPARPDSEVGSRRATSLTKFWTKGAVGRRTAEVVAGEQSRVSPDYRGLCDDPPHLETSAAKKSSRSGGKQSLPSLHAGSTSSIPNQWRRRR